MNEDNAHTPKKLHLFFMPILLVALLAGFLGCAEEEYSQVIQTNDAFISLAKQFIADVREAEDAKTVADALDRYADGMEELGPKMRALRKRYPELKQSERIPPHVKASQKDAEIWGKRTMASFLKVIDFEDDPDVATAQTRISKIFQAISQD